MAYNTTQYPSSASNVAVEPSIWPTVLVIVVFIALCLMFWLLMRRLAKKYQLKMTQNWVMYKIMVPKERHADDDDQKKDFHELLSVIEPFYSSLNSLYDGSIISKMFGQTHITLEIVAKKGVIAFYIGCPFEYSANVLKNLNAQYPHAEITQDKNYSIFSEKGGKIDIAHLSLAKKHVFPIKTYKNLEEDPLNGITNSLSKLNTDESAAIQLILRPTSGYWRLHSETTIRKIQEGKYYANSNSNVLNASSSLISWMSSASNSVLSNNEKPEEALRLTPIQENQIKMVGDKATKLGFECQLRIITVAKTKSEAQNIVKNIYSSFYQLNSPESNHLVLTRPNMASNAIANYVFRVFGTGHKLILNTEELASIFHAPNRFVDTPNISWLMAKKQAPPSNLPTEGTVIGKSNYRGQDKEIKIKLEDRLRHVYTIGQTGVGKTVLAQNMILQDIKDGHGVCYLDPNGDAAEWILNHIPKERADDVIYFNPADKERPMGLNMLEWKTPDQRDFLVQESLQIFQKLFDPNQTGMVGPQFEHWMRNAALTLMVHPDGGTIIDIPRIFTDPEFEKDRVKYVTDPVVRSFWEKQMAKTADFHKSEMLNYFTSKFGRFMTNDMIRNIIGQTKSSFDFRDVMDNKKILICNLSKGMIGEINAFLLGMIIVSKIAMGAFSRQDIMEKDRVPFFLYVDEFQNFITDVFATILSESRKYKLGLYITHQYIEQLDDKIRAAVFGNAGTLAAFRIGAADSEVIAKYFDPLKADDLTTIDKYNMYCRMLIDGAPARPFNIQTIWPDDYEGNPKLGAAIKELSRLKYGTPKEVVEQEILERSRVDVIDLPGLSSAPPPMH
ncbi:MAG: type IV secretory system conjugative DNA transfer family protein [bacterium]